MLLLSPSLLQEVALLTRTDINVNRMKNDCFILVLILATLIRPELFNWWGVAFFALCWERPRILFKMSVIRMRYEIELKRSEKQMLKEIRDYNENSAKNEQ